MASFTIELVSNASGELFPHNTLSSFTNFLPEQLNLEGQWEVAISEVSYPSMYQNITDVTVPCFTFILAGKRWKNYFFPDFWTSKIRSRKFCITSRQN